MASMDAWTGDLAPVESKLRQPWGDDPYADGGCTPGEVCQLQVQCWVLGAPAGILVAARGAEVHTRWVRHPEGAALREIEAAVEAIRRADREGWPAVADWLLARGQWDPYRAQGQAAEPRYAPELADAAEDLAECERLLSSARSEVRALERRRATVYCRLSEGGESEIDTGGHVVAPVYRAGRLSGWKVEA
jgi:plasmid stabilization system protein ParE